MASYTEDSVELREIMGKNIRERREGCGLSQSQLGKAIGSTQSYISTIENGSGRIVNCVKLYSIAQALDVSMDDLMGRQRSCPQKYTLLNEDNQEIIIKMIQVLLDKQQEPQGKSIKNAMHSFMLHGILFFQDIFY